MAQIAEVISAENAQKSDSRPLQELLWEADSSALLVPAWMLQNLVAQDRRHGESRLAAGRRKLHVISRDRFLHAVQAQGWTPPATLPDTSALILLARPEIEWLADRQWPDVLRHYWELLFHARTNIELREKLESAGQDPSAIQRRIEGIGRNAFHEACFVLQREHNLPPDADPRQSYVEFSTAYLVLHHFHGDLLPTYFPTINDRDAVLTILRQDVDDEYLFRKTQLAGACAEAAVVKRNEVQSPEKSNGTSPPRHNTPTDAETAAAAGNDVRAAIIRRALAPADDARSQIEPLAVRLTAALQLGSVSKSTDRNRRRSLRYSEEPGFSPSDPALRSTSETGVTVLRQSLDEHESPEWRSLLAVLLTHAVDVSWNPDARLLFDLQKVCLNHERELYSAGVVDWLLEGCRRRLVRPQPIQRVVLMCKTLRSADRKISQTHLGPAQQEAFSHLIHEAIEKTEARLRENLRPVIAQSLIAAGLRPHDAPERVAENKVIEELLDTMQHRGFLTLGRVRDVISSNQIKFDDIPGPRAFFTSDPLFRIDRQLTDNLDGVYHRGEIYLRLFQKISSAAFATNIGRFITRTVLIPIGGAFILTEAFDHTLFLLLRLITGWSWYKISQLEEFRRDTFGEFLLENMTPFVLVFMLLGVANWPAFNLATIAALRRIGHGLKRVLIDLPRWIAGLPAVQALAASRAARIIGKFIIKPLAIAVVLTLFLPHRLRFGVKAEAVAWIFLIANLLLNSNVGRLIEQAVLHWLRIVSAHVNTDILGNLFTGVMSFFARRLEEFDRLLYAVDEWLRFRHGEPRLALIGKALLGVFWFYVAYFARFAVNLLVEPQINPIKHFPVVTVSHKIILPTVGLVAQAIQQLGISKVRAGTIAACIVTGTPGIFGFIAWELRSNWKLYRSNRAPVLKPVPIGSHGETMARLLRPGFHSGTIPKIFARLRRASMAGEADPAALRKQSAAMQHVADAIEHFIEREFIHRLNEHPAWSNTPISISRVRLGPTRISVEIRCPGLGESTTEIFFEQRCYWILAGMENVGWVNGLNALQAATFAAALLGLYKIGAVDLVKQQIENFFGPRPLAFDVTPDQLIIWPERNFAVPMVYPLDHGAAPMPQPVVSPAGASAHPNQAIAAASQNFMLKTVVVTWDEWVKIWEPSAVDTDVISRWMEIVLPSSITPE